MIVTMAWVALGWISGWRLLRGLREAGSGIAARGGLPNAAAASGIRFSVIIPARDEERNLRKLLPSLLRQTVEPFEVIVVDDGSVDGTADVAREYGACVIRTNEPPAGWKGKSWACWQGAKLAKGEWLLFLDADTELAETGLRTLAAEAEAAAEGGVVTVQPYHLTERSYEGLSAFFNLIVLASAGTEGGERSGAFGPCLLCSRDTYKRLGGHAVVSGELLEHYMLGRHARALDMQVQALAGRGTVTFRMYPDGIRGLIQGWSKSFAAGAAATPAVRLALVSLWLAGAVSAVMLPLAVAVDAASGGTNPGAGAAIAALALYAAYAWQLRRLLKRAGRFHFMTAAVFPVPLAAFLLIFAYSSVQTFIRKRVVWRGRVLSTSSANPTEADDGVERNEDTARRQ